MHGSGLEDGIHRLKCRSRQKHPLSLSDTIAVGWEARSTLLSEGVVDGGGIEECGRRLEVSACEEHPLLLSKVKVPE